MLLSGSYVSNGFDARGHFLSISVDPVAAVAGAGAVELAVATGTTMLFQDGFVQGPLTITSVCACGHCAACSVV